ncbi:cell division protein FtsA, partial [Neisseria gonorrhoeae]
RPSSLRRRESGIVRFGNDWKSR